MYICIHLCIYILLQIPRGHARRHSSLFCHILCAFRLASFVFHLSSFALWLWSFALWLASFVFRLSSCLSSFRRHSSLSGAIYIYICIHIYLHIYMYTCYAYIRIHIYIYIYRYLEDKHVVILTTVFFLFLVKSVCFTFVCETSVVHICLCNKCASNLIHILKKWNGWEMWTVSSWKMSCFALI